MEDTLYSMEGEGLPRAISFACARGWSDWILKSCAITYPACLVAYPLEVGLPFAERFAS